MLYGIYFSHSLSRGDYGERLHKELTEYPYFKYKKFFMPPADPVLSEGVDAALKMTIENRMRLSQAVLVNLDEYNTYAKWIDMETLVAQGLGISVIAIASTAQAQESANEQYAAVVGKDVSKIVAAVRKLAL